MQQKSKFTRRRLSALMAGMLGVMVVLMLPAQADQHGAHAMAQAPATTVQEAAQRAIAANPEVQSSWHNFLAAVEEERVQFSGFLPRVDLEARAGRSFDREPGTLEDTNYTTATLQLTQLLYDGFFTRNLVRQFERAKLVRYYELLENTERVALEAFRAFEDVQRHRELVELARENYMQHLEVYDQIERRARSGVARMVDLEQIGGRLALAESNLNIEVSNLHDVTARYLRIVGELPADFLLPAPRLAEEIPGAVQDAIANAYAANPALHAAIENIMAARYERKRDRSGYHPQVDLRVRNTWNRDTDFITDPSRREVGIVELALTYNLYEGGRTDALNRQRSQQLNEAQDRREIVCRNLRQEVSIAWNDVQRIGERLRHLEAHRNATDRVRTAYYQQFDIGERGLLDLLDTENEFFEASRSVANATYDWSIAHARAQSGLGNLLHALGVAREGLPSLSDLDAEPVVVDPETICPPMAPAHLVFED